MLLRDRADFVEIAGFGKHDSDIHQRGFHDQARRLSALGIELLDALFHHIRVVERHRERHVDGALRDAGSVGNGLVVVSGAAVLEFGESDRDHHVVVVSVIRTHDLQDGVPAGVGSRDSNRVHRGFGTGVEETPLRQLEVLLEMLCDDDRILGGKRELRAEFHALLHGFDDGGVGVPLDHATECVVEVTVFAPVDAPDAGALAVGEVERIRVAHLIRGGDARHE